MLDVRKGLHDLAQPLTALECGLYLATMGGLDAGEMRAAIEEGLRDCRRMIVLMREMQDALE